MPTIIQNFIRNTFVRALIFFWSIFSLFSLIITIWKYIRQPGNTIYSVFEVRQRLRPSILDSKDWKHSFIKLSNIQMHYVESGDSSKPLMVCIHGFPEFWYSFRYQLRYFSKDYYVVALDLRGYGESDKPNNVDSYDVELLANDVAEFIKKIGKKAIVIGHDWGGVISWNLATHWPDLIDNRLIILNVPHPKAMLQVVRTKSVQLLKSWYIFMFQCPFLPEFYIRAMDFYFLEKIFYDKNIGFVNQKNFTKDDLEAWKYTYSQTGALSPPINYYRASMQKLGLKTFSSDLIKPKTLIIWGEKDGALEVLGAQLSLTLCADAKLERIPNASHWVQQDAPELVNALIEKFIKK